VKSVRLLLVPHRANGRRVCAAPAVGTKEWRLRHTKDTVRVRSMWALQTECRLVGQRARRLSWIICCCVTSVMVLTACSPTSGANSQSQGPVSSGAPTKPAGLVVGAGTSVDQPLSCPSTGTEVGSSCLVPTPQPCGAVLLDGSAWLGGTGVTVHSNYPYEGDLTTGRDCNAWPQYKSMVGTVFAGEEWQCVELVNRLWLTKGWINQTWYGSGGPGFYDKRPLGADGKQLLGEKNGAISALQPGDVVVFNSVHVGIVNDVTGTSVQIVSQNSGKGDQTYLYLEGTLSGGTLSGVSVGSIYGVVHAPVSKSPPPPSTTSSSPTSPTSSSKPGLNWTMDYGDGITLATTCHDFLFQHSEGARYDAAIRMSTDFNVSDPGNPMWGLNLDSVCGSDPNMRLGDYFGKFGPRQ
jgi:CHAP domain